MTGQPARDPKTCAWAAPGRRAGFTLMELMMVIALVAILLAVAMPRLWPAIAYGEHEGAARRLANYGRAAIAESAMYREQYTVNIDLETQEYWTVRWPHWSAGFRDWDEEDELERSFQSAEAMHMSEEEMHARQSEIMREQMERFARMSTQNRMRNVKREGILDRIGPLFDSEFRLNDEEEEAEEVKSHLLARSRMREGLVIDSVRVSGTNHTSGLVEIDVAPSGLSDNVMLYIRNPDNEFFTVIWDPITGGARIKQGREDYSSQ